MEDWRAARQAVGMTPCGHSRGWRGASSPIYWFLKYQYGPLGAGAKHAELRGGAHWRRRRRAECRRHDHPATPCHRLSASEHATDDVKRRLRATRAQLNPFALARRVEEAPGVIPRRAPRTQGVWPAGEVRHNSRGGRRISG